MLNNSSLSSIEENELESEFTFKSNKSQLSDSNSQIFENDNFNQQENQFHNIRDSFEIIEELIQQDKQKKNFQIKKQQQQQSQSQSQNNKVQAFNQQIKQNNAEKNILQLQKFKQPEKFHKKRNSDLLKPFQQKLNLNDNSNEYDQDLESILDGFLQEKNCKYCKKSIPQKILKVHEEQCVYREETNYDEIQCPYCGDNIVRAFINDHFVECIMYIEDKFQKLEGVQECSICMNEIVENKLILKCQHFFHSDCIKDWLKKKNECPVCREQIQNQIQ